MVSRRGLFDIESGARQDMSSSSSAAIADVEMGDRIADGAVARELEEYIQIDDKVRPVGVIHGLFEHTSFWANQKNNGYYET